jgi:hypothetical protein
MEPSWRAWQQPEEEATEDPVSPSPAAEPAAAAPNVPAWAAVSEPATADAPSPGTGAAPKSFIDKYRHLLEDDGAEPLPEPSPRLSRPILDDEYLSPSQASASSGEEDSDEALEAYMSNMMRRVRATGPPSIATTHAFEVVVEGEGEGPTDGTASDDRSTGALEMEIDANGMERLVRKPSVATNLAALRDLANVSARTAIAKHRKRRHVEATLTRGVVAVGALGASAYLLQRAPGVDSWWFWGGSGSLLLAGTAAAQLLGQFWHAIADSRRYAKEVVKRPASEDRVEGGELQSAVDEPEITVTEEHDARDVAEAAVEVEPVVPEDLELDAVARVADPADAVEPPVTEPATPTEAEWEADEAVR